MKLPKITLSEVRKTTTAVVGAVAEGVSAGLITGQERTIVVAVIAFLTAVGVYVVPNAAPKPATAVSAPPAAPSATA